MARRLSARRGPGEIDFSGFRVADIAGRGFLARLSPDLVDELVQTARLASYPTGTAIFSPREETGPSVVVSGSLRYFLATPDGRQLTIRYLLPGDLVGTLTSGQPSFSSHLEFLEPGVLLHMDRERMIAIAARRPELALAMVDELVGRLRLAYRALAAHAFMSVRSRVARDVVERANICGPLRTGLRIDVTQQSLADATGSVREVVSRALGELRREGVLATNADGITVLDPEALERAAAL